MWQNRLCFQECKQESECKLPMSSGAGVTFLGAGVKKSDSDHLCTSRRWVCGQLRWHFHTGRSSCQAQTQQHVSVRVSARTRTKRAAIKVKLYLKQGSLKCRVPSFSSSKAVLLTRIPGRNAGCFLFTPSDVRTTTTITLITGTLANERSPSRYP